MPEAMFGAERMSEGNLQDFMGLQHPHGTELKEVIYIQALFQVPVNQQSMTNEVLPPQGTQS